MFVKQRKEILGCSPIRAIDFRNEYLKRRKSWPKGKCEKDCDPSVIQISQKKSPKSNYIILNNLSEKEKWKVSKEMTFLNN